MRFSKWLVACACVITASLLLSCKYGNKNSQSATESTNPSSTPKSGGAERGVERIKPAPGTGNVQGKVFYNGKPVENIEVKLCKEFNRFLGGCSGKTYTTRTDKGGEYVITDVEPNMYNGLLARVFDTDSYVFATSGVGGISSAKYEISADRTLFVSHTNLFKSDLKLLTPKAGAKVRAQNLELSWQSYPEAAYYKFSVYSDDSGVMSPYIGERLEGTSFGIDKPLPKGAYRLHVEAYNGADQKLSESGGDINFTITDGGADS
jgi:hypothetical protein